MQGYTCTQIHMYPDSRPFLKRELDSPSWDYGKLGSLPLQEITEVCQHLTKHLISMYSVLRTGAKVGKKALTDLERYGQNCESHPAA